LYENTTIEWLIVDWICIGKRIKYLTRIRLIRLVVINNNWISIIVYTYHRYL
jgi:hypothetical protein